MVANKHVKMQLQIQEGTSVNIAVVKSVVTPSVPLRIHYAILPLRGLLWEAKACFSLTASDLGSVVVSSEALGLSENRRSFRVGTTLRQYKALL